MTELPLQSEGQEFTLHASEAAKPVESFNAPALIDVSDILKDVPETELPGTRQLYQTYAELAQIAVIGSIVSSVTLENKLPVHNPDARNHFVLLIERANEPLYEAAGEELPESESLHNIFDVIGKGLIGRDIQGDTFADALVTLPEAAYRQLGADILKLAQRVSETIRARPKEASLQDMALVRLDSLLLQLSRFSTDTENAVSPLHLLLMVQDMRAALPLLIPQSVQPEVPKKSGLRFWSNKTPEAVVKQPDSQALVSAIEQKIESTHNLRPPNANTQLGSRTLIPQLLTTRFTEMSVVSKQS